MRNKETYEITITSKLGALPLPNIEDDIWSRIEAQLDIDMPTNDGGGNTPPPKSPINFGWLGGAGLICITAILISIFSLTQSKDREPSSTTSSQEVSQEQQDSLSDERPPPSASPPKSPKTSPNVTLSNPNSAGPSIDSSTTTNIVPSLLKDSPQIQSAPPVAIAPQKDSVPPKRSRGVKGISDSDYRIVPKKDTT